MSQPLRIGIIGCGRILPAHLRGLKLLKDVGLADFRIVGLAARKLEDALMFARRGEGPAPRKPVSENPLDPLAAPHIYVSDIHDDVEVHCYDDWRKMLDEVELDAVVITTPVHLHHEMAIAAFARGLHCMVEKPLAISVRAGRLMVEAAKRRRLCLSVMEGRRFAESTRVGQWLTRNGVLGKIQMAAQLRIGVPDWSPNWVIANTPWRCKKLRSGGGASVDMGVHFIHELRAICGEIELVQGIVRTFERERVMKETGETFMNEVDDSFFAHYVFAEGGVGQTTFSWASRGEPTALPERTVIYGERGCLKGDRLVLADGSAFHAAEYVRAHDASFDERYFPKGIRDAFALAYLDWFRAIAAKSEPEMSGQEALRDLAVAFAICESSLAGRTLVLDDVLEGRVAEYQRSIDEHYFSDDQAVTISS